MPNFWIKTPSDEDLENRQNWANLGGVHYMALRHHLLVVERTGKVMNGPVEKQLEVPVGAKIQIGLRMEDVTKYTYGIQESITSTITSKLSHEVFTKLSPSFGLSLTGLDVQIAAELQSKSGKELVESLQNNLSAIRTYELQRRFETSLSGEFKVGSSSRSSRIRPVFIVSKLRQVFWDVFLYQTDFIQIEYTRNFFSANVRRVVKHENATVKKPLFRLAYFEPLTGYAVKLHRYQPDASVGSGVECLPLTPEARCPNIRLALKSSMIELARKAFRGTEAEPTSTASLPTGRPIQASARRAKREAVPVAKKEKGAPARRPTARQSQSPPANRKGTPRRPL